MTRFRFSDHNLMVDSMPATVGASAPGYSNRTSPSGFRGDLGSRHERLLSIANLALRDPSARALNLE